MKKIILILTLITLFAIPSLAQNSDTFISNGKNPNQQELLNKYLVQYTLQGLRVIIVRDSTRNLPSVTADSLVNADTVSVSNSESYKYVQFTITDTSTTDDTIKVERYDVSSAAYSLSVGMKDLSNDSLNSTATLIIPANSTKTYLINEEYPVVYNIIKTNTVAGVSWITIRQKN